MKIKDLLVTGEVKEILPNIFAVIIKSNYDRGMLFCRYQEFYESPFDEVRGKNITLEDFMKIYIIKNKKPFFTYTEDWVGYNIPSDVLINASKVFSSSLTTYDDVMRDIIDYCENVVTSRNNGERSPWYLIGVDKVSSKTNDHEIAHGLYYTNVHYKVEMDYLISHIKPKILQHLSKELIKIGYHSDARLIFDEIQAYMSTGKLYSWNEKYYNEYHKQFYDVFKKYKGNVKK
jgi:hypothetical protein